MGRMSDKHIEMQEHGEVDDEIHMEPSQDEIDRMYALYLGEKRAGMLDPPEVWAQKLRDAGRGHLIK